MSTASALEKTVATLPQFSAVSNPLLVSSEIKLLTKILASHYAVFGEDRYLAVRRVGHV